MITKWKVANFKSIREETELDFGPLTIFAGANSSGKSTFIQSILLIAQTLSNKIGSRSVVLNGTLTSLGQFDDLKSNDSGSEQISINCTCKPIDDKHSLNSLKSLPFLSQANSLQEVSCEILFDADPSNSQRELFQIQPRLFASRLSCISKDEDNVEQNNEISIRLSHTPVFEIEEFKGHIDIDEQLRASFAYAADLDELSLSEIKEEFRSAKAIGCSLKHFLPERITYSFDTITENANAITKFLQSDGRYPIRFFHKMREELNLSSEVIAVLREIFKGIIDFDSVFRMKEHQLSFFSSRDASISSKKWMECLRQLDGKTRLKIQHTLSESENLFERILDSLETSKEVNHKTYAFVQAQPHRQLIEAGKYLENFLGTSLKYLGPLRDAPKPLYPLTPTADPYDVGLRGEYTASILELHKNKKINYIPSANFKSPKIKRTMITRTLESAVTDWLQYLGVADSVQSKDRGKLGHELKVCLSNSENAYDLTHVGVGVSQVLPILVVCLLADTDTTLIFEQPELHLHPKVQTLLGDFFLSMALSKKQCIVETHSEYIIDRLRFRIAAASPEWPVHNQTKIFFVEKPAQTSLFREVLINEYGAISDWPDGFFDQSQQQAEEILRAAAMKLKANRVKQDA